MTQPVSKFLLQDQSHDCTSLQTHHMDSTLKRRGNDRFHVVSTWNPRGVFVGKAIYHMLDRLATASNRDVGNIWCNLVAMDFRFM